MKFVLFYIFAVVLVCKGTSPIPEKPPCPPPMMPPPPPSYGCRYDMIFGDDGCFSSYSVMCHTNCTDNEYLNECGNLCERRCGDPEHKWCPKMCAEPSCMCKEGYVRRGDDCVKDEQCPPPPPTPCPPMLPPPLMYGCSISSTLGQDGCASNFKVTCRTNCTDNEHLNECGNWCERRCGDPEHLPCPAICAEPSCVCDEGYVRRGDDCVKDEQCQPPPPPPEIFCAVPMLRPPGEGCEWEESFDSDGCPHYKEVCLEKPEIPCASPLLLPPGEGCEWEESFDSDGCPHYEKVCGKKPEQNEG